MTAVYKRILITGVTGSGGSYLAEHILDQHPECEVHGFSRWRSGGRGRLDNGVSLHECDLMDLSSVTRALEDCEPDAVFHLAAHANVRACFDTPLSVLSNNIMGTANLLEGLRMTGMHPRFVMCSSSEVYGQVKPEDVPIKETLTPCPVSPYAVSKLTQDALSHTYWLNYGLPVIRTRMFSYFNPRRADLFATSFARQVIEIERGERQVLLHGNLESVRTLIDIRDACSAYWAALSCMPGEAYNIGGETTMTVGDFLALLKQQARVPVESRADSALMRPTDVTLQIPDVTKFWRATGWRPQYLLEQSVQHLLETLRESGAAARSA